MALLQKFKPPAGATFGVLAERVLDIVINSSRQRIDVVFDVYKNVSIKNAERSRRTEEFSKGTRYKIYTCHLID
jgi:ABC-type microcin C transport system duplicated ATPase subunit YejF